MAGTSLLALLDDISSILDDIASMSKIAAKKTAGVLGDDLALNAQQVMGVQTARELPVVWAVAKGSLVNKVILVPLALAASALLPWIVTPMLVIGGIYLCFEGFEKIAHTFFHAKTAQHLEFMPDHEPETGSEIDFVSLENEKIKGAIRTDLVLSAEIIIIALGTVAGAPLMEQALILSIVAIVMTIGVYGLVAGIVKLDDAGLAMLRISGDRILHRLLRGWGRLLVEATPYLMKTLSIGGTLAMFAVGGGILLHGLPINESGLHDLETRIGLIPALGPTLAFFASTLLNLATGLGAGAVTYLLIMRTSLKRRA